MDQMNCRMWRLLPFVLVVLYVITSNNVTIVYWWYLDPLYYIPNTILSYLWIFFYIIVVWLFQNEAYYAFFCFQYLVDFSAAGNILSFREIWVDTVRFVLLSYSFLSSNLLFVFLFLLLLTIVLSVFLRITATDYPL